MLDEIMAEASELSRIFMPSEEAVRGIWARAITRVVERHAHAACQARGWPTRPVPLDDAWYDKADTAYRQAGNHTQGLIAWHSHLRIEAERQLAAALQAATPVERFCETI